MREEASPDSPPANASMVRVEISLVGRRYMHEVRTDVFLERASVVRRQDRVHWTLDVVQLSMSSETARDLLEKTLHMLGDDDKWAVVEPVVRELERHGFQFFPGTA